MLLSLAEKKRRLKVRKPVRARRAEDGEKLDARIILYVRLSEKVDLERVAEAQGESLCSVIRDFINARTKEFRE